MQTLPPAGHRHVAEYLQTPEEIAHDLKRCLAEAGGNAEVLIAIQEDIQPYAPRRQPDALGRSNAQSAIGYNASQIITDSTP